MRKEDVLKIKPGLYLVVWNDRNGGGQSIAAVGVKENGGRWLAPTNWVAPSVDEIDWRAVKHVVPLDK